jgi:hypothetical protein
MKYTKSSKLGVLFVFVNCDIPDRALKVRVKHFGSAYGGGVFSLSCSAKCNYWTPFWKLSTVKLLCYSTLTQYKTHCVGNQYLLATMQHSTYGLVFFCFYDWRYGLSCDAFWSNPSTHLPFRENSRVMRRWWGGGGGGAPAGPAASYTDISQYRLRFWVLTAIKERVPFELLDSAALLWRESCGCGGQLVFLNFITII